LEHRFISYKNSQVSWYRFGSGQQPVICFHGYGESGSYFSFLEQNAGNQFSFFAIDLPFHGKTEWNEGLDFTSEDLWQIINTILKENRSKLLIADSRLSLLGFSLGGRVALSLYQAIPDRIEKIVLLAPDGLKVNFWYWLSTQTWIGNKVFYFTMQNPTWFFGFLKIFNWLGLVNSSIFKFVKYYIDNKKVRHELYNRWITLRSLRPNLSKIKSLINQHETRCRLIYGKHDRIILSERGEKFRKGIEEYCSVSVIESGHQVLHEKHVKDIVDRLIS
jgi:pimeloyl-ACP methyl ester carboxylesterase